MVLTMANVAVTGFSEGKEWERRGENDKEKRKE